MKNLLLRCVAGLALAAAGASASTIQCSDQTSGATGTGGATLDKYIALGASGCMIGNLLYSNFAYSYSLGTDAFYVSGPQGTGALETADKVGVSVTDANQEFE